MRSLRSHFRLGAAGHRLLILAQSLILLGPASSYATAPPNSSTSKARVGTTLASDHPTHLRTPSRDEMLQFYAELQREGWEGAQIAAMFTGYSRTGAAVKPVGTHFATLYADVDGDRRKEWIVGCYFPSRASSTTDQSSTKDSRGMVATRDDRARVVIFKKLTSGPWRINWISPGLGYEFHAPTYNLREVAEGLGEASHLRLPISIVNIDGDRRSDIFYQCWSESPVVGALPGVYRFDGTRWVAVAPQADRFGLQDVDGDGKLELVTGSRYVGYGSGEDDVPRVWRWTGRQYQEASGDFPRFYSDLTARYRTFISRKEQKGEAFDRAAWERAIRKASSLAG